jgi:hypothetical protein
LSRSEKEIDQSYKNYWEKRNERESKKLVVQKQQKTVVKIHELICENLLSIAEQVN